MNIENIFPTAADDQPDERECARFKAIHIDHLALDDLPAGLGTPDEWLGTALGHLKVKGCDARREGVNVTTVSIAALDLLIWDWEARAVGGTPWKGNVA